MSEMNPQRASNPALDRHLSTLLADVTGVHGAVVASTDGFALAQRGGQGGTVDRLAAMTSSMLALATALGRELEIGALETLILDAERGSVLMLAIPSEPPTLLMVACDEVCVMGTVLWHAKRCVRGIAVAATSAT
jgi:predicted regulator of Ras-like GTPase activity (Roadblock/LC7/MglB family)